MEILVKELPIKGALKLTLPTFKDERGFLIDGPQWSKLSTPKPIRSVVTVSKPGTLRGLHCQYDPPLGRYVRFVSGNVFDVIVDLRQSSKTYGEYHVEYISNPRTMLWLPPHIAHGFYALERTTTVYDMCERWNPHTEATLLWNDERLGIPWPRLRNRDLLISMHDAAGRPFAEMEPFR